VSVFSSKNEVQLVFDLTIDGIPVYVLCVPIIPQQLAGGPA
jgi:hypothetical protein